MPVSVAMMPQETVMKAIQREGRSFLRTCLRQLRVLGS
jgi:hypothetical protein